MFRATGTWIFVGLKNATWSNATKVCLEGRKVCTWQAARDTLLSKGKKRLSWGGIKLL